MNHLIDLLKHLFDLALQIQIVAFHVAEFVLFFVFLYRYVSTELQKSNKPKRLKIVRPIRPKQRKHPGTKAA